MGNANEGSSMTQIDAARAGTITREMAIVAEKEGRDPEFIREGVAAGRIAIPANIHHTSLSPEGVGGGLRTKVNVNLGISGDVADEAEEWKKVDVALELPETYLLGTEPEVYAVYTVKGGTKQEKTSVRVEAEVTGLAQLLDGSTGVELEAAKAVKPKSRVLWLLGISLGSTAAAAAVTLVVVRLLAKRKKRRAGRR